MRVVLLACTLWMGAVVAPLPDELPATIDLAHATWTRNGVASDAAAVQGDCVHLPVDGMGVRWATEFETGARASTRLTLEWEGSPEGLLFEVVLDGERLSPPRDGWRPTARRLRTDLGPRWLGRGRHLLEFVAREDRRGSHRLVGLLIEPP